MSIIRHNKVWQQSSLCLRLSKVWSESVWVLVPGYQVTRNSKWCLLIYCCLRMTKQVFSWFYDLVLFEGNSSLWILKHWKVHPASSQWMMLVWQQLCPVMTPTALHSCKFSVGQKTCYQALLWLLQSPPVLTNQTLSWGGSGQSQGSVRIQCYNNEKLLRFCTCWAITCLDNEFSSNKFRNSDESICFVTEN